MIIDSHAHYAHRRFTGEFSYLHYRAGAFDLSRGEIGNLLEQLQQNGICLSIEAGIGLEETPDQLALAHQFPALLRVALGVHPKRCVETCWEDREKLEAFLDTQTVVAIGETGLDYSMSPDERDVPCQKRWFDYQIQLAHQRQLPLILHIRDAHEDGLEMLRQRRALLHGGVAHCFGGDYETAMAYIDLGFALGIGGRLLHDDPMGLQLQDVVSRMPLSAILVETDAPYILPDIRHLPCSGKQRKKIRNTSLILPAVVEKIAALRQQPRQEVEQAIYQNTLRVFPLAQEAQET